MDDTHRLTHAEREQRIARLQEEDALLRRMLDQLRARNLDRELADQPHKKPSA